MTKKINTPKTNPESGGIEKTEQLGEQTSDSTLSVLADDKNTMLLKKFNELTDEKRREYLHTVFGTIRGTTGFFDIRYTAGTSNHVSMDIGEGKMAHMFVRRNGMRSDESSRSESSNTIEIIMGDKLYSSDAMKYYEHEKIDRKYQQYTKVISCTFNDETNTFAVQVECGDGEVHTVEAKSRGKYEFEEELLGKLRVPTKLLDKEENAVEQQQEGLSPEQKVLAQQKMFQKAIDILILENKWVEVEKYMDTKEISLSDVQKKQCIDYLVNGRKQGHGKGMREEDFKRLAPFLKTIADEMYVKDMVNTAIEKTVGHYSERHIEEMKDTIQEILSLAGMDMSVWRKKTLECKIDGNMFYRINNLDEIDESITKANEDERQRYQRILEKTYQKNAVRDHRGKIEEFVPRIAEVLGREEEELLKEIFQKMLRPYKM